MPGGRNGEEGLPVGAGPGLPTVGGRAGDVVTYDFGVLTTGPVIDGARATLVVPQAGRLMATGEVCQQYRLLNGDGPSRPTSPNFRRRTGLLQTARSYGMDLLRWFRFLWAVAVAWDRPPGPRHATSPGGCR